MVAHAYHHVPYYRALLDKAGVLPSDIRGAGDMHLIPVTTRSDIQAASMEERLSRNADDSKLLERKTTGSTGQCLVVKRTWNEEQVLNLFRWRAIRAYGLRRADIIGVPRVRIPKDPRDNQIPRRIADALHFYRKTIVDLRSTSDQVATLYARRPEVIMGWPTILSEIAPRWAELKNVDSHGRDVRFVITGGEVLTPSARDQITNGFSAPVRDMYGAHEFSLVAWQCAVTAEYHLSDETLHAEVIRDGKPALPGETGEMIVTALHSFAMPFIRYKLGDVVTQGSAACSCGSPFSTIRSIRGRAADYLKLPGGRLVHPQDIARESYIAAPWIKQLQVVQEEVDRFTLLVLPLRNPSQAEIDAIRPALMDFIGPEVFMEVVIVSSIDRTDDSKFRVYKSRV
jgi:phenylacetate-CoA ligase